MHEALTTDLDASTLYGILRLRVDVFVVEQECAYAELDGRDLEPTTRQLWCIDESGAVLATLRLLHDGDDRRIGRVATAVSARGRGLAATLMTSAVDECAGSTVRLDAQERLEGWYARFGFVRAGDTFLEDGLPHVPMIRGA